MAGKIASVNEKKINCHKLFKGIFGELKVMPTFCKRLISEMFIKPKPKNIPTESKIAGKKALISHFVTFNALYVHLFLLF